MNKNLHRIVFNARRGQRMVVAETANSQGKSAGGETRAGGIAVVAVGAAMLIGGHALAQIKADSRAPGTQQATVLTTANGVPQVNIQTPSAGGVSRNVYSQFDVQSNGAVLNNSRTGTSTAVGGYVQANPWMAQGTARIILNEVNSTAASQLQGPIEVAGQRAEVIIANPAGIAVNGGSFINASAVTLTTGTAVVNGGNLDAYRVQGGMVTISGHGLDTSGADYTAILSRAVQVNAGIWAKELRVVTGNNDLNASGMQSASFAARAVAGEQKSTTQASSTSGAPAFALDVSALGGMYAGKIFLVGTEAGLGVRMGGTLGATAGDVVLSNNGWLSNSGSIYASGDTRISTQGAQTHSGVAGAQGRLTLAATGADGSITSTTTSLVAGGLKSDGSLGGNSQTTINASQGATLSGKLIASGELQLSGSAVSIAGAQIQADSATIKSSTGGTDLHADKASITIAKTLTLSTGQTLYTAGASIVANKLSIAAHDLSNTGGTLGQSSSDDLQITLAGKLDNGSGHIASGGNVQLSASSLSNADKGSIYAGGKLDVTTGQLNNGGSLYAGGDLNLQVGGSLSNTGPSGLIASGGNTSITTGSLTNGSGASIIAGMQSDGKLFSGAVSNAPRLTVNSTNGLNNQGNLSAGGAITLNGSDLALGGTTNAGGNIGLQGNSIAISGNLVTAQDLNVQAKSQLSIEGMGQIGGSASVNAGGSFSLGGQFTINKDLNLTANSIGTAPGSFLMVGHNASLSGGAGVSLGGATTVGNRLTLSGNAIDLSGPVDAAITAISGGSFNLGAAGGMTHWKGNLSLSMSGDVNAKGGLTVADGASITSGGKVHIGGNAQSGGELNITASGDVQVDGTVTANAGSALSAGGNLQTGSVQASSVSLDGQQVTVTGSVVGTTGATHLRGTNGIAVTGDVTSGGGGGVVATTSGALDIGGATTSGAGMTLQAGSTIHLGQQTQATGSMHLQAGGNITADKGLAAGAMDIKGHNLTVAQNIWSGGALQAQTNAFNVTGNVLSGGDTVIVAAPQAGAIGASTVQIGGALATTGALNVQSTGTLQVTNTTQADGTLQLKAQGITLGGKTTSGGNSSIDAQGAALAVAGMVGSGGNQNLAGSTITVQGAQALGSMDLQATSGKIDSSSSLLAANGLTAHADGAITVQGHIASDGATTLQSTGQVNATGTIGSGAAGLKVDAGGDIAAATLQSLGNSKLTSTANVTLGNALNIGSYTVSAGGNISQAQVQSGAGLSETAGGGITHSGTTLVQGDALLTSGTGQTLGSTPTNGLIATGSITATAATGTISVGSDLLANGNISTTATQGAITVGGNLSTQGSVGATAQTGITVGGALTGQSATLGSSAGGVQIASNVQVQTNLNVTAQTNVQAGGNTVTGGTLNASSTAGSVAFNQDLSVGTTTHITAGNGITLGGNSKLVGAAQLQSTGGTISNGGVLATNQTLTVSGNADLVNHGSMQSVGNMSLGAHNITSNAGAPSTITTAGALTANATGTVNLDSTVSVTAKTTITLGATGGGTNAGNIQAGNAISLSGGTLANSGQIASQTVNSTGGISNTGTVYGSNSVAVTGSTSNTGQIVATISVSLGDTTNNGVIQSQTVNLGATSNGGSIAATSVTASSLSNQGSVGATNDINVSGDVNNSSAIAATNINFGGGTLVNSGQVHASGNITINASSIDNTAVITPPIPGAPPTNNVPYASAGTIKADGILAIGGGSLNNTGTLSSGGVFNIAMSGGVDNNKKGFILAGGDISISASSVNNNGNVYGINTAPSTVTIASTGGFANGSTGVLIAGSQLNITAASFTNAGDNISAGVGSLGNANLSTTGVWEAGANPLKVNGLLTANTNGITVDVGKTWEAQNVKWGGTLTNYGTTNLGIGEGTVVNQSTGVTTFNTAPDPIALAGSYQYSTTPPAGYTGTTLVGYTDVTNRAKFTAGSYSGGFTNIAGDVSGTVTGGGYLDAPILQALIWSGVPMATPGATPELVTVSGSLSLARGNFTANSVINLVGPSAGTIVGGNVTINAGDLTVDKSNTGAAQGGIAAAQGLTVGSVVANPATLALLQNPALVNAAGLQNAALIAAAQANTIPSGTVTTTVGTAAPVGTAGSFTTNNNGGANGASGDAGPTLALPAPDLSTVQGAFAALNAKKVNTIITDWQALGAKANAINVTNLNLNLTGVLTNAGSINATSTLTVNAAGGINNSGGTMSAAEWVQLDAQGLGLINSGGVIKAGGQLKANVTGDIRATGGSFVSTNSDIVLDATGKLSLVDTTISAKNGVAHLYGTEGVSILATQNGTTTDTQAVRKTQTVAHAAVAASGPDGEGQAPAYTEVISDLTTATTTTQTKWNDSKVDADKIDIQSSKGGVTLSAGDLNASNGIRISAAKDVELLAQRGTGTTTTSITGTQQQFASIDGEAWGNVDMAVSKAPISGTTETLRTSSLNAGAGTLSIESTGGNITGQSAQLAGNKIVLITTKTQDGTNKDADGKTIAATAGGGSITLGSLQVAGKTAEQADNAEWSAMNTTTLTTVKGSMTAANGITISANKDVALGAIALDTGKTGDIIVQAGGNVTLGANADAKQTNQTHNGGGSSFWTTTSTTTNYQTQDVNAAVTTLKGKDITIKAGDTLTNYAAQIDGQGTVMQIAGKSALTYTATQSHAATEDSKSTTSMSGLGGLLNPIAAVGSINIGNASSTTSTLDTQQLGSKIFGQQVGVQAKDVVIVGAEVVAKDLLSIKADNSVTIAAATNTSTAKHDETKSGLDISANIGSGVALTSSNSTQHSTQTATTSSASQISGNNVVITSGGNTTVTASTVIANKDATIVAGGDINIMAATNTETSTSLSTGNTTTMGMAGGASARQTIFSNTDTKANSEGTTTTATTSVLSANTGTLNLVSGGKFTSQGAELLAKEDVKITAKSVDLQAITDASNSANQFESHSFTVGAALAGTVGSKITAISDAVQTASSTSNERLQGAATLKAGYDAYKLVNGGGAEAAAAAAKLTDSLGKDGAKADPNSGSAFGVSISVGMNSTKQDSTTATTQNRGTSIQANNVSITATEGDITATGAKLQAANINLDAAKDINLLAATNTSNIKSSNESHSLGGGVTFGVGQQSGISFQLNAGQANGNTNGTEVTYDNTLVTATNKLTVKSGGNTNLVGAQLAGDKVKMDVGGDLNVVTLQDTSNFNSEQHSSGIALSLCIPPLCVGNAVSGSVSKSDATIEHNYISATGQSGIAAGAGGYDITVKGNTDLKGGAITSTAPQDQNTLKTGSLTSSDLANAQNTNSQSSSISLGYGGGSAMATMASNLTSNALSGLGSGNGMPANGSSTGTTQSVISPGNVTITGTGDAAKDANSNAQVATLTTRDATKANGSLVNTLTLQQAQLIPGQMQTAKDNALAANLAGAAMDGMIGDVTQNNGWLPGSPQATLLHGMSGAIQATIGGTNAASGFASGALNEQAITAMGNYLVSQGIPKEINGKNNPTYDELMKTGSTLLGAGTAAVLNGTKTDISAGANIAKNGTEFNALVHDQRKTVVNAATKGMTPQQKATYDDAACALAQCAAGLDPNNPATEAQIRSQFRGSANTPEAVAARTSLITGGFEPVTAWENIKDTGNTAYYAAGSAVVPLKKFGNDLVNNGVDFVNKAVDLGIAVIKNGPGGPLPQDLPPTDDGRPPTAGGATVGVAGTLPTVVPCGPGLCVIPPIGGVTGVRLPANVMLNVGGNNNGNDDGNSTTSGTTGSANGTGASTGGNSTGPSTVGPVGANGATGVPTGISIPANSANAGVGLRNDLSIQAGVPTSTSNVWGASLDDLKQAFNTGGTTITPGSARASSSGNSQILNVEGSSTGVVQVQYSPASTQSSHGGQYYKFTYADGAELKVIDPATYRVLGWPENGGKTTFQNPSGKVITYDPVSKTWR